MEILDIIVIVLLLGACVRGIFKGFISQAISVCVILLGAWASFHFSTLVSGWLKPVIDISETTLEVISFVVVFIVVAVLLVLLGKLLEKVVKLVTLGWVNRLLGAVFATVKGFLIIGMIFILFDALNEQFNFISDARLNDSVTYGFIKDAALAIFPYFKQLI